MRTKKCRGLTLIELMLAVLGCSLLLFVLLGSISSSLQAERNADLRGAAIRLAGTEIARFKSVPFDDLKAHSQTVTTETWGRPYKVTTTVKPSAELPDKLFEVEVVVAWKAAARELSYHAKTKRSKL